MMRQSNHSPWLKLATPHAASSEEHGGVASHEAPRPPITHELTRELPSHLSHDTSLQSLKIVFLIRCLNFGEQVQAAVEGIDLSYLDSLSDW